MATRASTRDPKVAKPRPPKGKTEKDLLKIATTMFCERGFNGTSVAEMAKAAGVTNAGLHYYFETKQELLLRVLEAGMSGFLPRLEEISETSLSPREKLDLAIENHLDFVFRRGDAVAVFLRERRFLEPAVLRDYQRNVDRYDHLFREILAEGVASGDFPPIDVTVTSLFILGAINSMVEWRDPRGRLKEEDLARIVRDMIVGKLLARPSDAAAG